MSKPLSPKKSRPKHIAFIMDGNGRWAEQRGLSRLVGHRKGYQALRKIADTCLDLGIPCITFYAFSKENWKRPKEEVDGLQALFSKYLDENLTRENLAEARRRGLRFRMLGNLLDLPPYLRVKVRKILAKTRPNRGHILNVAFSYGGRAEIVEAAKKIAREVQKKKLKPGELTEEIFSRYLYTGGCPDPDLLIRTGGEFRVSNFLLYQIAYAEIYVTRTLWPDFQPRELKQAIREYQHRERRFGMTSAQIKSSARKV
ncbi:MAG: polyprenyl diphosphate synthase [Proteobacteria bacterium]|nr:polyprenyl diphosphate synthase [Pseudomonadota bacterium]